jgi:pimeloyl-ACP methyl ester carboxylesterase
VSIIRLQVVDLAEQEAAGSEVIYSSDMDAVRSLYDLRWTSKPKLQPLPAHIKREYIQRPHGRLEVLVCEPKDSDSTSLEAPVTLFAHGGFGSAGVWIEWMTYLYESGHPGWLVAYSARGHGGSYALPYIKMVFGTAVDDFVEDLTSAAKFARERTSPTSSRQELVLAGHSSGGGLIQYAMAKSAIRAHALCLVDAMPHFGMLDAYWNWFKHDPLFPVRMWLHLGHPASPLSSTRLVRSAFFGPQIDSSKVVDFMRWMAPYESMGWPISQFGSFWLWLQGRNEWLDIDKIVKNINAPDQSSAERVLILVGDEDMMFNERMYFRQAEDYRRGFERLVQVKKIDKSSELVSLEPAQPDNLKVFESSGGVALKVALHAGHHFQNDVQSAIGAQALQEFIARL